MGQKDQDYKTIIQHIKANKNFLSPHHFRGVQNGGRVAKVGGFRLIRGDFPQGN